MLFFILPSVRVECLAPALACLLACLRLARSVKIPRAISGDDGPVEEGSAAQVAVAAAQFCEVNASRHPHRPTAVQRHGPVRRSRRAPAHEPGTLPKPRFACRNHNLRWVASLASLFVFVFVFSGVLN